MLSKSSFLKSRLIAINERMFDDPRYFSSCIYVIEIPFEKLYEEIILQIQQNNRLAVHSEVSCGNNSRTVTVTIQRPVKDLFASHHPELARIHVSGRAGNESLLKIEYGYYPLRYLLLISSEIILIPFIIIMADGIISFVQNAHPPAFSLNNILMLLKLITAMVLSGYVVIDQLFKLSFSVIDDVDDNEDLTNLINGIMIHFCVLPTLIKRVAISTISKMAIAIFGFSVFALIVITELLS